MRTVNNWSNADCFPDKQFAARRPAFHDCSVRPPIHRTLRGSRGVHAEFSHTYRFLVIAMKQKSEKAFHSKRAKSLFIARSRRPQSFFPEAFAHCYNYLVAFLTRFRGAEVDQTMQRREEKIILELLQNEQFHDEKYSRNGYYTADEKKLAVYEGLFYSSERKMWLARFRPANPESLPPGETDEATLAEVFRRGSTLHHAGVKPSQSLKALADFDRQCDAETKKLFSAEALR